MGRDDGNRPAAPPGLRVRPPPGRIGSFLARAGGQGQSDQSGGEQAMQLSWHSGRRMAACKTTVGAGSFTVERSALLRISFRGTSGNWLPSMSGHMHQLLQDLAVRGADVAARRPASRSSPCWSWRWESAPTARCSRSSNALLLRPLAGRADEMVGLYSHDRTKPDSYRGFSYPNYVDIRDHNDVFDGLMAHTFAMVGLPAGRHHAADVRRGRLVELLRHARRPALPPAASFSPDEERPGARHPGRHRRRPIAPPSSDRRSKSTRWTSRSSASRRAGFTGTMALDLARHVAAARHVRRRGQRHVQEHRQRAGGPREPRRSSWPGGWSRG